MPEFHVFLTTITVEAESSDEAAQKAAALFTVPESEKWLVVEADDVPGLEGIIEYPVWIKEIIVGPRRGSVEGQKRWYIGGEEG